MVDEGRLDHNIRQLLGSHEATWYLIHDVRVEVARFNGHKSSLKGMITLIVSLMSKYMVVDFLFMKWNAPYSGILGRA